MSPASVQILVLDDEPEVLRVLGKCLFRQGYAVQLAERPSQALQFLRSHPYDLMISDVRMPERDGLDVLREVHSRFPAMRVVVMTGLSTVENAVESFRSGAVDFVQKPFNVSEIVAVVERAVKDVRKAPPGGPDSEAAGKKDDFLRVLGHELKMPMAVVQSLCRALEEAMEGGQGSQGRFRELISSLKSASRCTVRLVEDWMELYRLEANKMVLVKEPVSIAALVQECVQESLELCREKGLVLTGKVAADLPRILADRMKLRQALFNLIDNAVQFTPRGGTIAVEAEFVEYATVRLAVRDSGIGIAPDQHEKIFEKFFQAEGGGYASRRGLGLGLALVKAAVEAHGGVVTVVSFPGKGSSFFMRLPAYPVGRSPGTFGAGK